MPTIYVVTSGQCSDYHIVGVYDDCALADKAAGMACGEVEEHEINPGADELNQGLALWHVMIELVTGSVQTAWRQPSFDRFSTPGGSVQMSTLSFATAIGPLHGTTLDVLDMDVWARDEDHAVKIASERRREYLAQQRPEDVQPPTT
jgi:hypothetical protein